MRLVREPQRSAYKHRLNAVLQSRLTVGSGAGALVAGSAGGSGRFAAFVTSLRLDPVELAMRLIFPFAWPFFSLELPVFDSGSSCAAAAREAFGGIAKRMVVLG